MPRYNSWPAFIFSILVFFILMYNSSTQFESFADLNVFVSPKDKLVQKIMKQNNYPDDYSFTLKGFY